jgi:lipopolysaccharide transport system permease protein
MNPMVGVIDGVRWCILDGQSRLYLPGLAVSVLIAGFFLWFGVPRFRNTEKSFYRPDLNALESYRDVRRNHHR